METGEALELLLGRVRGIASVRAIGISGSVHPLPKAGEGDIDVFMYCAEVPAPAERDAVFAGLEGMAEDCRVRVLEGGRWGSGDFASINGVETWLMYFTQRETLADVNAVLAGEYPDKLDNYYYPVGRLAMLQTMTVLYDRDGFLQGLKDRLAVYPPALSKRLADFHLRALGDTEDLARAAERRDALFYHFALDLALDHFLQALFAMNRKYFPSRKRTLQQVSGFAVRPERCGERLLEAVRLGGTGETVSKSLAVWERLTAELKSLYAGLEHGE